MPAPKSVRALERAIDVLLSLSQKRPGMDVSELQRGVGLARPTLYRLLATLERRGLVRACGTPLRYELGFKVVELAGIWLSQNEIADVSRPILEELRSRTDETIALMVPLSVTRRLCVMEIKSRQPLTFSYGVGHTGVTYLGASGKAILAHLPEQDAEAAIREASNKASISPAKLRTELADVRKFGYAVSEGEVTAGTVAIAAPVFDRTGAVAGSVTLYGPAVRVTRSTWQQHAKKLLRSAAAISTAMGYNSGKKKPPRSRVVVARRG
jgi:DNA-binding IclR family transcriptional regulator